MQTLALTLRGDLRSDTVIPWIVHRGQLLNLAGWVWRADPGQIELALWGPQDLLDAMEAACSLGPMDVLVETIERAPHAFKPAPNTFSESFPMSAPEK